MGDTQPKVEIGLGDIVNALWRSLRSTQTTVYLLVIIAIAGLIGTMVPQGQSAEFYAQKFGTALAKIIQSMGFDHLFTRGWFLFLLALLTISTVACARRIWRLGIDLYQGPSLDVLQRRLSARETPRAEGRVTVPLAEASAAVQQQMKQRWYRVEVTEEGGTRWLVGRKFRWSGFGIVFSHIALFAIVVGSILGSVPALKLEETLLIPEGETYHFEKGNLYMHLNKFNLDFYPNSDTVKAFKSDVTLYEGKKAIKRQVVVVNRPLQYKGVNFYQSTWGRAFRVRVTAKDGRQQTFIYEMFPMGQTAPGQDVCYAVPRESAVQVFGDDEMAVAAREYCPTHQNATLVLASGFMAGGNHQLTNIQLDRTQPYQYGDYQIELLPGEYYTGLEARRDYGVPFVWAGFIMLVFGVMSLFYFRPQTVVAHLQQQGGAVAVRLAAYEKGGPGSERWGARETPMLAEVLAAAGPLEPADTKRPTLSGV